MAKKAGETVRVTRHFNALPEKVFVAWINPAKARKFLFATKTGNMVRAEIDARPGGSFIFTDQRDGEDIDHIGTYIAVDRPHKIVFSFYVPKYQSAEESTIVTIDIANSKDGSDLTLTHEGVLLDYKERTKQGWIMILDQLESKVLA
jgi:uncharacterized protein YndB with AHSA1/START domain